MKMKGKTHNLARRLTALTVIFSFLVTNMAWATTSALGDVPSDGSAAVLLCDGQELAEKSEITPEQELMVKYTVTMAEDSLEQSIALPETLSPSDAPLLMARDGQFAVTREGNQLTITRQSVGQSPVVSPTAVAEPLPAVAGDSISGHAPMMPPNVGQPPGAPPAGIVGQPPVAPPPTGPIGPSADGDQPGVALPPVAPPGPPTGDPDSSTPPPIPGEPVGPGAGGGPQVGQPQPAPEEQPPSAAKVMPEASVTFMQPCTVNWNADQSPVTVKLGSRSYQLTAKAGALDMGTYLTTNSIKYQDGTSWKDVPIVGSGTLVPADANLQISSKFEITNAQLTAIETSKMDGTTHHYKVATLPKFVQTTTTTIAITLKSKDGKKDVEFAQLHIDGQEIYVTFVDQILTTLKTEGGFTTPAITAGYLGFDCQLIEAEIKTLQTDQVTITIGDQDIQIPVVKPPLVGLDMKKAGKYTPAAGTIDWIVTITPGDSKAWIGAVFEDTLTEGQTLVPSSFQINQAPAIPTQTGDVITSRSLLAEDQKDKTIIITYSTYPPDSAFVDTAAGGQIAEDTPLKNTAKLTKTAEGVSTTVGTSNEACVTIKSDDKAWVSKTGVHHPESKKISWTVQIHNNGYTLTDVVLNDEYPDTLTLVDSSVQPSDASITKTPARNGFTVAIGSLATNYTLTYDTTVKDSFYEQSNTTEVTNRAWMTFKWTGHAGGSYDSSFEPPSVTKVPVPPASIVKSAEGYNPANQEITWKITVNQHHVNLSDVVVTDTLGTNQAIIPIGTGEGKQEIRYAYEGATSPAGAVAVVEDATNGKVTFTFPTDTGKNKITFTYKTKVTRLEDFGINTQGTPPKYSNKADLAAMVTPESSTTKQAIAGTSTALQPVQSLVLTKAVATPYNYETKRIGWKVVVNQNKMAMTDAVLTDILPEGLSMPEEADNIKVDGKTIADPDSTTYEPSTRVLTVTLGDLEKKEHTITFETAVNMEYFQQNQTDDQGGKFKVTNNIKLNYQHNAVAAPEQSAGATTADISNQVIEKKGTLRTGMPIIDYEILINPNGLVLHDPSIITDKLPQNAAGQNVLELDTTTLKLYEATMDADDKIVTKTLIAPRQYTYTGTGDNTLTVILPVTEGETRTYCLTYSADIAVKPTSNVVNQASFNGMGQSGTDTASGEKTFYLSAHGGGSVIDVDQITPQTPKGEIKIIKKDAQTGEPIQGVEFEVFLGGGSTAKGTTDANGELAITGLKVGAGYSYTVKEIQAPDAYQNVSDPQVVLAIDPNGAGAVVPTLTFVNPRKVYPITFAKVNDSKIGVKGAEFALYPEPGTGTGIVSPIPTAISDADGKVSFTAVPWGSYLIKETKAPAGYYATEKVGRVTLAGDGKCGLITDQATGAAWAMVGTMQAITNKRISNDDDPVPDVVLPPFGGDGDSGFGRPEPPIKQDPSNPIVIPPLGQPGAVIKPPVDPTKPLDPMKPVDPMKPLDPLKPLDPTKPLDPLTPAAGSETTSRGDVIGDQAVPAGNRAGDGLNNDGSVAGDGLNKDGSVAGDGMNKGAKGHSGAVAGDRDSRHPQTGDDTPLALLVGLFLVGLTGLGLTMRKRS